MNGTEIQERASQCATSLIKDLESVIIDVLDGLQWHDIQPMTGLPEERCREIEAITNECLRRSGNEY